MRRSSFSMDSFSRITSGLSEGSGLRRACSTDLNFSSTAASRRSSAVAESRGTALEGFPAALDVAQALAGAHDVGPWDRAPRPRPASASRASKAAFRPASRSARDAVRAAKNASWAARNRPHSSASAPFGAPPAAFHSVIRSRKRAVVGPQLVELAELLGLGDQLGLAGLRRLALLLDLGEVHPAPALDGAAGRGQPGPERVVGLAIEPASAFHRSTSARICSSAWRQSSLSASFSASAMSPSLTVTASARAAAFCSATSPWRAAAASVMTASRASSAARSPTAAAVDNSPRSRAADVAARGRDRRRPASPGWRPRRRDLRTCGRNTRARPRGSRPARIRPRARRPEYARRQCRQGRPDRKRWALH